MTEALEVVTTTSSREDAERIARELVGRRLAACVQVAGPISSTYHWQGNIETSQEWLCVAKTVAARFVELETALRELHPYEVPEILAFRAAHGGAAYLAWLAGELSSQRGAPGP